MIELKVNDLLVFEDEFGDTYRDMLCKISADSYFTDYICTKYVYRDCGSRLFIYHKASENLLVYDKYIKIKIKEIWRKIDTDTYKKIYDKDDDSYEKKYDDYMNLLLLTRRHSEPRTIECCGTGPSSLEEEQEALKKMSELKQHIKFYEG